MNPIVPKRPLPVVAIVCRPNVGKSSLLNALAGKRVSIVQDMPGVTRDRVSYHLDVNGRFVELVDTGGYGFEDEQGLTDHIKHQIETAMARADLVLFVVDCTTGPTAPDREIGMLLRRQSIPTIVLVNKADGEKADPAVAEFADLGFGVPIGISALNDRRLDQVADAVARTLDLSAAPTTLPDPSMYVAIVGKRNAGKSSLVNSIARLFEGDPERVIVSEVPGTTRDSVDVRFEKDGKALVVIDTAGVRKKRHMVTNDIEFYSFHRAQRSIRRADVVLFLLDATEPISEPDKKLADYVASEFKPVIVVINKWDLARETLIERSKDGEDDFRDADAMEKYKKYVDAELRHLDYAPMAFTTAKDGRNVQGVIDLAQHLNKQANERLGTGRLNAALEAVTHERAPSAPKGRRPKIYYATQVAVNPPTIVLFVNNADFIDENYRRYVVNRFRDLLPYPEVPIKLQVRGKGDREPDALTRISKKVGRSEGKGAGRPAGAGRTAKRSPEKAKPAPLKAIAGPVPETRQSDRQLRKAQKGAISRASGGQKKPSRRK